MYGINPADMSNRYIVPISAYEKVTPVQTENTVEQSSKVEATECQTCKNRKYQDGSNDPNVSFKAPGHISPEQSYGKVMSHELEHVANARTESSKPGAKLISATVSLQMGVCPECGRTYVEGGTTRTTIQYQKGNPYDQGRKTIEGSFLAGQNIDKKV